MEKKVPNLYLENAEILPGAFRNFAGRQTQYNKQGDRNFNIVIDEKTAKKLLRDGWNVRKMKPRDENDPRLFIFRAERDASRRGDHRHARLRRVPHCGPHDSSPLLDG